MYKTKTTLSEHDVRNLINLIKEPLIERVKEMDKDDVLPWDRYIELVIPIDCVYGCVLNIKQKKTESK